MIVILVFHDGAKTQILGSGFLVGIKNNYFCGITAKHVFPNIFFTDPKRIDEALEKKQVKILLRCQSHKVWADVEEIKWSIKTDAAIFMARNPLKDINLQQGPILSISSEFIAPGTAVVALSYAGLRYRSGKSESYDGTVATPFTIDGKLDARIGKVLDLIPNCTGSATGTVYATNIPTVAGMSGGPVLLSSSTLDAGIAIGIITSDMSPKGTARHTGITLVSSILHCFGLPYGGVNFNEFVKHGIVKNVGANADSIEVYQNADGTVRIDVAKPPHWPV